VVASLGLRELGPSQLELGVEPSVEGEPKTVQQRVVALDPRKPSEGEQAQPAVSGRGSRGRREPLDVDRVTDPVHLDRPKRERADVRRENRIGQANRKPEGTARHPMLIPEEKGNATRLRKRRREQKEERDHVGEHGVRTRLPSKLCGELAHEEHAAREPVRSAEGAHPDVGRQLVPADTRAEYGNLVKTLGEGPHEVERLCEDGMVGVECLGDDDESQLGSRPAAIVLSASRRRERANSSGV